MGYFEKILFLIYKRALAILRGLEQSGFDISGSGVIILQLELAKEPYAIAGMFII